MAGSCSEFHADPVYSREKSVDREGVLSTDDVTTLRELGYAQELLRGMRSFQNFAVSFEIGRASCRERV